MLIIMLCHRKSNKDDVKKPDITDLKTDHFKDGDGTSNISDLKLELRQVEGSCDIVSIQIRIIATKLKVLSIIKVL